MSDAIGAPSQETAETTATRRERTVYLETFGCQMNSADSDLVLARLAEHGWSRVDDAGAATLVLYNTCAVRDHAEAKVRGRLGALKAEKQRRPGLTIGVMGCMAQREKDQLVRRFPHVDLVVGTDQFVHMPQLIDRLRDQRHVVETAFADWEDADAASAGGLGGVSPPHDSEGSSGAARSVSGGVARTFTATRQEGVNAYVPVMRGCNYNCTYCVVPFTRGKEKSRRPEHIEDEVRRLVDAGHVQVTLLGQTVDAYGKTLGDGSNLARLLRRLHEIPGLKRLRFVTSHPKDISDELLDTVAELPRVAKHLHVPAQCGSDRILRLMGRRYTRDDYLRFVARARARMPDVELLSDFIVGFPRETDEDFRATASLMEEVRFAGAYVFIYSERPATPASHLDDDVPEAVKKARCNELLAIQLRHQQEAYARLRGSLQQVLVEGPSKSDDGMLHGRSLGNLNIVFPRVGADGASRDRLVGDIVGVRIERSTSLTLFGELA